MNKILNVYKPIGATPLQIIQQVQKQFTEYQSVKIGYAGRLDPLAHGVLLLMIGDATKERDIHLGLEKEYEFEAVFGVQTDTYDMLGLVTGSNSGIKIDKEKVNSFVKKHIGNVTQYYPPYSSKTVDGKPLFWWAKNNKLNEITIPQRTITIESFELISFDSITNKTFSNKIEKTITNVSGDFRQNEIKKAWEAFFSTTKLQTFQTAKFRISCSSGTYVRGLVYEMGKYLGCGAIALDIKRTKVGQFSLENSLRLVAGE